MKKITLVLLGMITMLSGCHAQNYSGEMTIHSSQIFAADNYYEEYITVCTNLKKIDNYEMCAQEIIDRCIANNFENILFDYSNRGYPNRLVATVFPNSNDMKKGRAAFQLTYSADSLEFDIKNNPDHCAMEIQVYSR